MSLSFLGKKSFHPSSTKNLAKLFEAEEKEKTEKTRREELQRQWEQEETRRQTKSLIRKDGVVEAPPSMGFMYNLPPGLAEAQEKARGKAADDAREKTRQERDEERFPMLKNAPRQGEYTLGIEVSHRPFGVELRKVRCTRCQQWGHQNGDRECPLRNQNPMDGETKAALDPMDSSIRLLGGDESSGAPLRWAPKAKPEDGVRGDFTAADANQQFVVATEEEMGAAGSAIPVLEPELLSMLSEKQQRKLTKMYQRELAAVTGDAAGEAGGGSRRESKHKKKHKKAKEKKEKKKHAKESKKRRRSDSDSDSGSS